MGEAQKGVIPPSESASGGVGVRVPHALLLIDRFCKTEHTIGKGEICMKKSVILIICLLVTLSACHDYSEVNSGDEEKPVINTPFAEEETIDIEEVKNSCVMVSSSKREGDYIYGNQGSGVVIDYDKVLTCYHLTDEGVTDFEIQYNDSDKNYIATLESIQPEKDLAILKPSKQDVKPVKLGTEIRLGEKIYIISSPQGKKNVVTTGTVVAPYYNGKILSSIQTKPGSSGGGVFNTKGELIGIVSSRIDEFNETYFVPLNNIKIINK